MSLQSEGTNYKNRNGHIHELMWLSNISNKKKFDSYDFISCIVLTLIISTMYFIMTIPRYRCM